MNFFRSTLERDGERCFVRLGDTWLPVRAPIDAARREGAPVIAGLRPEHLGNVATGDGTVEIEVTPSLVESLGGERYVHFPMPENQAVELEAVREAEASGGGRMIARLVGGARAAEGQRLRLAIDVDQLHLFDPETELALD